MITTKPTVNPLMPRRVSPLEPGATTEYGPPSGIMPSDYRLSAVDNGDMAGVQVVTGAVYGVGFHGLLPPNAMLALFPAEQLIAAQEWGNATFQGQAYLQAVGELHGRAVIVYPGEVHPFDPPVQGCIVRALMPWTNGFTRPFGSVDQNPAYAPIARIYRSPGLVPSQIGWRKRGISGIVGTTGVNPPTLLTDAVPIPLGSETVSIHWLGVGGAMVRVGAAQSNSYSVWWLLADGLWAHNPADDCTGATDRGLITAAHDAERYAVGPEVVGVFVYRLGGGAGSVLNVSYNIG